jgi:hypothetical protein
MEPLVLPKPAYNLLRRLTGETRPDVALSVALKDLVRLRLEAAQLVIANFEEKYGVSFNEFQEAWQAGRISAQYSYAVEGDYWAWEAAVSDVKVLQELAESMA